MILFSLVAQLLQNEVKFEVKPALLMGGRLALFHYSFSQVSEITFSVLFPAGKGDRFVFMGEDISKLYVTK
jgi:hypothetical protein